jgi:MFS family permease
MPTADASHPTSLRRRVRITLATLAAATAIDAADARVLPALFRPLERRFGYGPERLSALMVGQSLALAISSPAWGHLADRHSRVRLLAYGCFLWALWTALMAAAGGFYGLLATRTLAGAALAAVTPIAQSLVADLTAPASRGTIFGVLVAVGNAGAWVGGVAGTSLGSQTFFAANGDGGVDGWRLVLLLVAAISLALGALVLFVAHEPPRELGRGGEPPARLLSRLMRIRTFQLIVLQGVFGAVPWNALSFTTMWLQYAGYSDLAASSIASWHLIGGALGGMLGGVLGDLAARWSPSRGRVRVAQTSTLGGVPIIFGLLTRGLDVGPAEGGGLRLSVGFFALGLVSSWCSSGVNRPLLSEIVPDGARASIMAWSVALEGSSAALFGAPVVGILAERAFGYQPTPRGVEHTQLTPEERAHNASALARAMVVMTCAPWLVCCATYGAVGLFYERDRERARKAVADVSSL